VLVAFALVVAACSDDDSTPDPTPAPTAAPPAATDAPTPPPATDAPPPATDAPTPPPATDPPPPPEPVVLRAGMGNLPPSAVPWTGAGSPGQYVWAQIFDALTYTAPDGTAAPGLATSWTNTDENTWEFTLREGVTFSNGDVFNADSVVGTFAILLSEDGRATYSANVNNYSFIDAVTKVDDMTVQMTTSAPNVLLPKAISLAYIVSPDHFNSVGAEAFATAPIGTGAFVSTSWTDQAIMLEGWAGSWRDDPSIAGVEFLNLNDSAARLQALQSGQVNIAQSISPDQIGPLGDAGFTIFSGTRGSVQSLALIANAGGPLADPNVRLALNYAVDTATIVEQLLAGVADAGVWPSRGVNGYDASRDPIGYDPAMATTLLTEAGYPNGFDFVAEVTVGSFPADALIYEAMQGYLAEVGVNVELQQIAFGTDWLPKFLGRDGATWAGQAFGLSWNAAPLMDAIRPFNFYSCGWLTEFFCDEAAEALITQINGEFDVAARNALLTDLLAMTQANPPAIWLVEIVELWAHDANISGFSVDNFNARLENVTVSG
jgi:peptide/nickel transport system substrate-binding protein